MENDVNSLKEQERLTSCAMSLISDAKKYVAEWRLTAKPLL